MKHRVVVLVLGLLFSGLALPPASSAPVWTDVQIGTGWVSRERGLALTTSGQPRLVVMSATAPRSLGYAECDTACDLAASWTLTTLAAPANVMAPQIALDGQGRPRIGFWDHGYLWYGECDSACTAAASWSYAKVDPVVLAEDAGGEPYPVDFSFALDGQGRPRFAYEIELPIGSGWYRVTMRYAMCDAGCTSSSGWDRTEILAPGVGGVSVDGIEGRAEMPRLAFQGTVPRLVFMVAGAATRSIAYAECAGACQSALSWQAVVTHSTPAFGSVPHSPDVALVAGRARVAFAGGAPAGIGYQECTLAPCTGLGSASKWTPASKVRSVPEASNVVYVKYAPSLLGTPGGGLRLLYGGGDAFAPRLNYSTCESLCHLPAQWSDDPLPDWSAGGALALHGSAPRLAYTDISGPPYALHYAACDPPACA